VGLETFIPPAPVVQSTLTAAAMDRGSSDVMDEVRTVLSRAHVQYFRYNSPHLKVELLVAILVCF
jgi:hypothetical protein